MSLTASEQIRRRFGNKRPGLELLGLVEAAVPVTVLRVDVLAQERKQLPLLDEFIIQFVHEGVRALDELAALLGLEHEQVLNATAEQIREGNIRRSSGHLALTAQGTEVARTLAAIQPVLKQLPVPFDRIVWSIKNYAQIGLINKKAAEEHGYLLLPRKKQASVALTDLTVEQFNELIRDREDSERLIEILRIRKIASQTQHLYLPAQLLVYGNPEQGEVELELCIDGELQPAHGLELAAIGAAEKLGFEVGQPEPRPTLSPELEEVRVPAEQIEALVQGAARMPDGGNSATEAPQKVTEIPVRSVSMLEHPDHLNAALDSARKRILIISPWVRGGVVTTNFVERLERRLRAGVEVHIGYGIGPDDRDCDEWALRKLRNLAQRHGDRFHFVRLKNTHAKILIYDGIWINTSFNWLSFKGDPNRTFRMEEGTLVQISSEVDKAYKQYVEVLETDIKP
ncbi:phospholipase D-like domain-containing protein [Kitasatospora griseola]|uniref:phospholipase D-like domain-containing protein n=1 Tax=Kitasatospora griseola TaxID=2064 RepID=UPI0034251FF7